MGSIPGLRGFPGEGNGNALQYSCLENPMERGAWEATVHGVSQLDTTLQLTLSLFKHFETLKQVKYIWEAPSLTSRRSVLDCLS